MLPYQYGIAVTATDADTGKTLFILKSLMFYNCRRFRWNGITLIGSGATVGVITGTAPNVKQYYI